LRTYKYDLVILDWNLPGCTGVEVCQQFRADGGKQPVLMLTGRAAIADKAVGFTVGADDYLTKPFDLKEISLRVRALLKRPQNLLSDSLEAGPLRIDQVSKEVFVKGGAVTVTPREYSLLELLMRHKNRPMTAEEIVNAIWSNESEVSPLTVKTVVSRLRAKLSDDSQRSIIHNIPGVGYCIKDSGTEAEVKARRSEKEQPEHGSEGTT
jgi:DNA-binding response OmpR family regulator